MAAAGAGYVKVDYTISAVAYTATLQLSGDESLKVHEEVTDIFPPEGIPGRSRYVLVGNWVEGSVPCLLSPGARGVLKDLFNNPNITSTWTIYRGAGNADVYQGCVLQSVRVSARKDGLSEVEFTLLGTGATTAAPASPAVEAANAYPGGQFQVLIGGSLVNADEFEATIEINREDGTEALRLGGGLAPAGFEQKAAPHASGRVIYDYDGSVPSGEQSVEVKLVDGTASTFILLPRVRFADPGPVLPSDGANIVKVEVPYEAYYDATAGYIVSIS